MKTNNKKLIKLLGILGILESEEIKENNPKTEDDITYTTSTAVSDPVEYRVLPDSADEETANLLLKAEQLKTLKSIQKMLKFFTALTLISLVCAFLLMLVNS